MGNKYVLKSIKFIFSHYVNKQWVKTNAETTLTLCMDGFFDYEIVCVCVWREVMEKEGKRKNI